MKFMLVTRNHNSIRYFPYYFDTIEKAENYAQYFDNTKEIMAIYTRNEKTKEPIKIKDLPYNGNHDILKQYSVNW